MKIFGLFLWPDEWHKQCMKIGILGAGQLSRMLIESTKELEEEISLVVFVNNSDSQSIESIKDLGVEIRTAFDFRDLQFVTFENEFVNIDSLKVLQSQTKFFPSLEVIELMQNKLFQKTLLNRLGVPTSPWQKVSGFDSNILRTKKVLKWARFGYDGKGTFIFEQNETETRAFLNKAFDKNIEVYAEEFISYLHEVSLVCARNWSGDIVFYPLVETRQANGICHDVSGGQTWLKDFEIQAQGMALKILEELNYVGVLAVEMFVDANKNLVVNEMAPRVHNSGHVTQLAASISQFEAHMRAGLDLALERPVMKTSFYGMWNLVPKVQVDRDYKKENMPSLNSNYQVYWYQKSRLRTGRKMGHINFMAATSEEFEAMREELRQWEGEWNEALGK